MLLFSVGILFMNILMLYRIIGSMFLWRGNCFLYQLSLFCLCVFFFLSSILIWCI